MRKEPTSQALIETAERAYRAVADTLETAFRTADFSVSWKDDGSPVTNADQAAEAQIRAIIEAQFPDHGFLGEESGTARETSPYCWIIDPIDGTKSFISGLPSFATLIGFAHKGVPQVGLAGFPALQRCFTASTRPDGTGKTLENGKPIAPRPQPPLDQSAAMLGNPMALEHLRPGASEKFRQTFGMLRYGGDTLAPLLVAQGRLQVVLEADYDFYDYAALVPLVTAQGGIITDWHGNALTATTPPEANGKGVTVLASVNQAFHETALKILQSAL